MKKILGALLVLSFVEISQQDDAAQSNVQVLSDILSTMSGKFYELSKAEGTVHHTHEQCNFTISYKNPKRLKRFLKVELSTGVKIPKSVLVMKTCLVKYCTHDSVESCIEDDTGGPSTADKSLEVTEAMITGEFEEKENHYIPMSPIKSLEYQILDDEAYSFKSTKSGEKTLVNMMLREPHSDPFVLGFYVLGRFGAASAMKLSFFSLLVLIATCVGLYGTS